MRQHLVVEGKDYFFVGELCKIHFPIPSGFNKGNQKEFLKGGKGFNETLIDFSDVLKTNDLTNVGLIVDADYKGIAGRFQEILNIISKHFDEKIDKIVLHTEGVTFEKDGLKIGIWIMPNNADNGYLEHFIENLIEQDDWVLNEAKDKVDDLLTKEHCRFTEIKKQKAIIYSWLAWQESPGLPFGTAMKAKSLNAHSESAQPFLNWIKNTFEF